MRKNTGKEYEDLVETIFRKILAQDAVNTLKIERNITLQGKGASHEIDIYWSFEIGNIKYETIVQAKDEVNKIPQGKLFQFKAIRDDLPGQPKGIFVTRTGYQSGAIDYAAHHGIGLYEFRKPTDADFQGMIREIHVTGNIFMPHFSISGFSPDQGWTSAELEKLGLKVGDSTQVTIGGLTNEINLYDDLGDVISNIYDLGRSLIPQTFDELPPTKVEHVFVTDTFIDTMNPNLPKLKINALEFMVQIGKHIMEINVKADDIIAFILENTLEKKRINIDRRFNVHG